MSGSLVPAGVVQGAVRAVMSVFNTFSWVLSVAIAVIRSVWRAAAWDSACFSSSRARVRFPRASYSRPRAAPPVAILSPSLHVFKVENQLVVACSTAVRMLIICWRRCRSEYLTRFLATRML